VSLLEDFMYWDAITSRELGEKIFKIHDDFARLSVDVSKIYLNEE